MANWYGTARTNYVTPADRDGLIAWAAQFDLRLVWNGDKVAFFPLTEDGGFPSEANELVDGFEIYLNWVDAMEFIAENEVLVVMCVGAEKQRYVTGEADAYVRRHGRVDATSIDLEQIYDQARDVFGASIAPMTYALY